MFWVLVCYMQGPHIILIVLGDHFVPAYDQILCKKMNYVILRAFQHQKTPLVMSLKTMKTEDTVVVVVVSDIQLKIA